MFSLATADINGQFHSGSVPLHVKKIYNKNRKGEAIVYDLNFGKIG